MSVDNEALNTVIKKLNNSYQIWLIVGICQIVFGFWYVTPIFFGAWNIYCAVNRKKLAAAFRQNPAVSTTGVLRGFAKPFVFARNARHYWVSAICGK